MDRLLDLKNCTESYYKSIPSSLIEDTFLLLNLIAKAARIIKEYDESHDFPNNKSYDLNDEDIEYRNTLATYFKENVVKVPHLPINCFYPQATTYIQNKQNEWTPLYADIDNLFITDAIKPYYIKRLIDHIILITNKDLGLYYDIGKKIESLLKGKSQIRTKKKDDEYTYRRQKEYQFYQGLTLCFYTQIQIILFYINA